MTSTLRTPHSAQQPAVPTEIPHGTQDAPPDYTPALEFSPAYAAETFHQPLITYHLRATKKGTSHLVSYEPATSSSQPSYEVNFRSSTALTLFNRKAAVSVSRVPPPSSRESTVLVATARFHDEGGFPYYPRARLTIGTNAQDGGGCTVETQSRDWQDWTFSYGSVPYTWKLCDVPRCLELQTLEASTSPAPPVIARFTYGRLGTRVLAGGEVGHLSIWRDALTDTLEGREMVVVSCLVVVRHFKGLGRVYRNDERAGSVAAALINPMRQERTTQGAGVHLL